MVTRGLTRGLTGGLTRGLTGDAPEAYAPFTAYFDTTDELSADNSLAPTTSATGCTLSAWFVADTGSADLLNLLLRLRSEDGFLQTLNFFIDSSTSKIGCTFSEQTSNFSIFSDNAIVLDTVYHVLVAYDQPNDTVQFYVNDVKQASSSTSLPTSPRAPGLFRTGSIFDNLFRGFDMFGADFWYDDVFLDLDVEANRRKFADANGFPVSLGANGEKPSGSTPILYVDFERVTTGSGPWNKGAGIDFTETGTVTTGPRVITWQEGASV